ncbi:hypothetical protein Esti_006214 [Eimeria stiedai]
MSTTYEPHDGASGAEGETSEERMARAALMLGIVAAVFFFTVLFGADVVLKKMREEPGTELLDAIPEGMTGNLIRLGGLISAFGPMPRTYLIISFLERLRHCRILRKYKKMKGDALSERPSGCENG